MKALKEYKYGCQICKKRVPVIYSNKKTGKLLCALCDEDNLEEDEKPRLIIKKK